MHAHCSFNFEFQKELINILHAVEETFAVSVCGPREFWQPQQTATTPFNAFQVVKEHLKNSQNYPQPLYKLLEVGAPKMEEEHAPSPVIASGYLSFDCGQPVLIGIINLPHIVVYRQAGKLRKLGFVNKVPAVGILIQNFFKREFLNVKKRRKECW